MKLLPTFILLSTVLISNQGCASQSAQHASKAVKHSTYAVGHSVVGVVKVASVAVAVPLIAVGSLGHVTGSKLINSAMQQDPLTITEHTITAEPSPKEIMASHEKDKHDE